MILSARPPFSTLTHGVPQIVEDLVSRGAVSGDVVAEHVYIVYGFSKDFCMNGLRIGLLYSRYATA